MSDEAQILVLPTGYDPEGDEAAVLVQRPSGHCWHNVVTIQKASNTLVCRRCDAVIDPLDWIAKLASEWQQYRTRVEMAKNRAERAEQLAEDRIKAARRLRPSVPMPVGKRLATIVRMIGRSQSALSEATAELAGVLDHGSPGMATHYLADAEAQIGRARSSLDKLIANHAHKTGGRAAGETTP